MAGERILVVEDEPGVLDLTVEVMRGAREGYTVEGVTDAAAGLEAVRGRKPDLVLLDLNLGRRFEGLDVCRQIRVGIGTADVAIIILTGELTDAAEAMLLDAGVDDYIRKPQFTPRLLQSRVRAVLRRARPQRTTDMVHGPLRLRPARREALIDGKVVNLTPTEFDILLKLASHSDRVLERRELLDRGGAGSSVERTVDVHVLSIRRKLRDRDWLIETVFGVGYRLGSPERPEASDPPAAPSRS